MSYEKTYPILYVCMYVCIIAFNPVALMSQSPEIIKIPCAGCTPDMIMIRVDRTITANNLECGEYNVSANFTIIQGSSCVTDIKNKKWYNGWEYVDVRANQTFHLHCGGQIDLKFDVITTCGVSHQTLTWSASPCNSACEGCYNTYSFCDFWESCVTELVWVPDPNNPGILIQVEVCKPGLPVLKELTLLTPNGYELINESNNYGIFDFPYYMHVSDQCNLPPDLYDFVFHFNKFTDLAQTGNPDYAHLYGHAKLIDNFTNNNPAYDCKIYIKYEDLGFYVFNMVFDYRLFDSGTCTSGGDFMQNEHVFADIQHFPYSYDCGIFNLPPAITNIYTNSQNLILGEKDGSENTSEICIFPTISSDIINIQIDKFDSKEYYAELYNSNSQKLIRKPLLQRSSRCDISQLAKGIYFVKITSQDGLVSIKKIIKN